MAMIRVLVPVDGSPNSERAVRYVISLCRGNDSMAIELLNVQEPIDSLAGRRFKLPQEIRRMQQQRSVDQLRPARACLDRAGIRYEAHVATGRVAETIVRVANRRHYDMIVMGTRGMTPLANLVLGSVATKVIHLARMPVTLVK